MRIHIYPFLVSDPECYIQNISYSVRVLVKKSALLFFLSLSVVKYDVLVEGPGFIEKKLLSYEYSFLYI